MLACFKEEGAMEAQDMWKFECKTTHMHRVEIIYQKFGHLSRFAFQLERLHFPLGINQTENANHMLEVS